ncbi:hypothetical protein [Scopulibacillus cellulosilyticus]|uniref:Uncharacterized protein n=1 Tax=Scopulibacillus cellulosilyticus TaxID=2665665 RepID=A0ABW2PQ45_9BACL
MNQEELKEWDYTEESLPSRRSRNHRSGSIGKPEEKQIYRRRRHQKSQSEESQEEISRKNRKSNPLVITNVISWMFIIMVCIVILSLIIF